MSGGLAVLWPILIFWKEKELSPSSTQVAYSREILDSGVFLGERERERERGKGLKLTHT